MKIEERGEPWLRKQIMKSNKLSRRMEDFDNNGFGRNRRGGIDYMSLIAEMQIYKDEGKKARAEAELLPENILARKIAQRGLAHSTAPAAGGRKRNERWPATPAEDGKKEKDKGGKGKKGKADKGKGKSRQDSSRGPSDRQSQDRKGRPESATPCSYRM